MITWLRHQRAAASAATRRLFEQPVAFFLTTIALGVAISLPTGLYLGLATVGRFAGDLPTRPEISVYLKVDASADERRAVTARLGQADVAQHRYVSKDEALAALQAATGLADVAAGLADNPLPDAWIVLARGETRDAVTRLAQELGTLAGVEEAHLDGAWADRLHALLALGRAGVWLLGALFGIAFIAVADNAIRSQVLARRDEIEVSRLVGATDRYIRRPFLYLGALQGLAGGVAAGAILAVAGGVLQGHVVQLAALYGSAFRLAPPAPTEILTVLALATLSGLTGAWLAVGRTLRQVEASAH